MAERFILLVVHAQRPDAREAAAQAIGGLLAAGVTPVIEAGDLAELGEAGVDVSAVKTLGAEVAADRLGADAEAPERLQDRAQVAVLDARDRDVAAGNRGEADERRHFDVVGADAVVARRDRANANVRDRNRRAQEAYERQRAAWRARVDACRSGDYGACER